MEENIRPVGARCARKRSRNPETWKRAKAKLERYSAKELPQKPACKHLNKTTFKCQDLTMMDIKKFHDRFYSNITKVEQDAFILKYCHLKSVVRRRAKISQRQTEYATKMFVKKANSTSLVHVCQDAFLRILRIPRNRVRRVAEVFKKTGGLWKEKRGGDHRSHKNVSKLQEVKKFIESFKVVESHYCRSTTERKYLPSDLNIKKMWRMYSKQAEVEVKECYFRRIFNTHYNVGFGNPRTDVCSTCTELLEKIKVEKDDNVKKDLMMQKRLHNLKFKRFYYLLNERRDGMCTVSFDCQKNQVLPKIADQIAYYSRQLYIYNFATVLQVPSKLLNQDTVNLYTWTENEFKKGANEIVSCVFDRLNRLDLTNINTVRLVADGCGAQNKNTIMIGMVAKWLLNAPSNVQDIELVFPIPGHSFLPADRVFGNIERELKKKEVIISPEEYHEIFSNYGTVTKVDAVYDWKSALHEIIKPPSSWHFQFAQSKRFFIKRKNNKVSIRGEPHYSSEFGQYKSILKKGKSFTDLFPLPMPRNEVSIQPAKLTDVEKLLTKHFGADWNSREDLTFYKNILAMQPREENGNENNETQDIQCEHSMPESYVMV